MRALEAPIFLGSGRNSCDHVTFKDCLIERNLGDENADRSMNYNNISFIEDGASANGSHMDSITFDGCHVGVSNGRTDIPRNIGSPRAGLECYTQDNGDDFAYHGWSNVKVIDCVFEATDSFCIDLADSLDARGEHISGPALISGCTLKGGGYASDRFAYTICLEAPKGVVIENNLIYRGRNRHDQRTRLPERARQRLRHPEQRLRPRRGQRHHAQHPLDGAAPGQQRHLHGQHHHHQPGEHRAGAPELDEQHDQPATP